MPSRKVLGLRALQDIEDRKQERKRRNQFRWIWFLFTSLTFLIAVGMIWNNSNLSH